MDSIICVKGKRVFDWAGFICEWSGGVYELSGCSVYSEGRQGLRNSLYMREEKRDKSISREAAIDGLHAKVHFHSRTSRYPIKAAKAPH